MPCTLKIRIVSARDLPVMDRKSRLADPFVTLRLGTHAKAQTSISRKTLNPVWNELFRFELLNDIILQEEPLLVTVYDKDTYTADDPIGSVSIDLTCLLQRHANSGTMMSTSSSSNNSSSGTGSDTISGYFPLWDSFHGVRGYVQLSIKINFFQNLNPFNDSIAASSIQFFAVSILEGYVIEAIHGFTEELILERDPEYHWVDSFRASRTSNDARLQLFYALSKKVIRNVGRKTLALGGNAVVGFTSAFDLEGESGIVARASGTAVTIRKIGSGGSSGSTTHHHHHSTHKDFHHHPQQSSTSSSSMSLMSAPLDSKGDASSIIPPSTVFEEPAASPSHDEMDDEKAEEAKETNVVVVNVAEHDPSTLKESTAVLDPSIISSALEHAQQALHPSSAPPSSHHLHRNDRHYRGIGGGALVSTQQSQSRHEYRREVHLLTMTSFPSTVQICLGGMVCARAVKLLDPSRSSGKQMAHDRWFTSLRKEIQTHARALNCTTVIGYSESTTIHENIIVLSAIGTAARVGWFRPVRHSSAQHQLVPGSSPTRTATRHSTATTASATGAAPRHSTQSSSSSASHTAHRTTRDYSSRSTAAPSLPHFSALKHHRRRQAPCAVVHVPYSRDSSAFRQSLRPCGMCGKKFVPELILTSTELYACENGGMGISANPTSSHSSSHHHSSTSHSHHHSTSHTSSSSSSLSHPSTDLFRIPILGYGQLIEARVCRVKKKTTNSDEQAAQSISESLPFLEYELHRQLVYKLRVLGMNAAFGLKIQIVIGENLIVGVSTATAVFIPALPSPPILLIKRYIAIEDEEDATLVDLQRKLMSLSATNRIYWNRMMKVWKKEMKTRQRRMKRLYQRSTTAQQTMTHAQQQLQQQQMLHRGGTSTPPTMLHSLSIGSHSPYRRGHSPLPHAPHSSHTFSTIGPGGHSHHQAHPASASHASSSRHHSLRAPIILPPSATPVQVSSSTLQPRSLQLGIAATSTPITPNPVITPLPAQSDITAVSRQSSLEDPRSSTSHINDDPSSSGELDRQISTGSLASREQETEDDATLTTSATTAPTTLGHVRAQLSMSDVVEEGVLERGRSEPNLPESSATASSDMTLPSMHPLLKHSVTAPPVHESSIVSAIAAPQPANNNASSSSSSSSSDSESSSSSEDSSDDELIGAYAESRSEFVLQIDDEADEDLMSVLLEPTPPDHIGMCNTEVLPGMMPRRVRVEVSQQQQQQQRSPQTVSTHSHFLQPPPTLLPSGASHSPAASPLVPIGKISPTHQHQQQIPSPPHTAASSSHFSSPHLSTQPLSFHTSLPNVQLLTLVRRVQWKDDVGAEDTQHKTKRARERVVGVTAQSVRDRLDAVISSQGNASSSGNDDNTYLSGREAKLTGLNRLLSSIYHDLYAAMCLRVQAYAEPFAYLAGIRSQVHLPSENTLEVVMTGMAVRVSVPTSLSALMESAQHREGHGSRRRRNAAAARRMKKRSGKGTASSDSTTSSSSSSSSSSDDELTQQHTHHVLRVPRPPKNVAAHESGGLLPLDDPLVRMSVRSSMLPRDPADDSAPDMKRLPSDEKERASDSPADAGESGERRRRKMERIKQIGQREQLSSPFAQFHSAAYPLLHPPLPASLHASIDPATHKAYGMPLYLPPLNMEAMLALRKKVIRQVVNMNEAAGREIRVHQSNAPVQIDALALTPLVGTQVKHTDRGLNEFLLEHNAAAASLQAQAQSLATQVGTIVQQQQQRENDAGLSAASALSILAAASIPQQQQQQPKDSEQKDSNSSTDAAHPHDSSTRPPAHHLSIHLPPNIATIPSPSPTSSLVVNDTSTDVTRNTATVSTPFTATAAAAASTAGTDFCELLGVEFTPFSFLPGATITNYLGRVHLHLIKECSSASMAASMGGLSAFIQQFLLEIHQLARAHVWSRGGNGLIGFTIQQCFIDVTDNQSGAYCIVSISGDAVKCVKQAPVTMDMTRYQMDAMEVR